MIFNLTSAETGVNLRFVLVHVLSSSRCLWSAASVFGWPRCRARKPWKPSPAGSPRVLH